MTEEEYGDLLDYQRRWSDHWKKYVYDRYDMLDLVTPDTWVGHWDFLQENSGIVYFTLFAYGFAICHFCNRLR